jgi:sec-independent protein translocase protein TatA
MFRNPTTDLIVVLVIVLLIFGPKRLPSLGRQLGQGMREFKDSITGKSSDDEAGERPEIASTSASGASEPLQAAGTPDREAAEVASSERRS